MSRSSYLPEKAELSFRLTDAWPDHMHLDLKIGDCLTTEILDLETFENRLRPYGQDDSMIALGDYLVPKETVREILTHAYTKIGYEITG